MKEGAPWKENTTQTGGLKDDQLSSKIEKTLAWRKKREEKKRMESQRPCRSGKQFCMRRAVGTSWNTDLESQPRVNPDECLIQ